MDLVLKNAEGYYDLTAYQAIKNITDEENRKKEMYVLSVIEKIRRSPVNTRRKKYEYSEFFQRNI
ncbi:MAG: hypothetical protein MR432_07155 [Prevotellaceae bacterium]|nr:hypothetical protein [Prevotellaceae bacterium]